MNDQEALTAIREQLDVFFRGGNPYETLGAIAQITGLNGGDK